MNKREDKFITIAQIQEPTTAHLYKTKLEDEEIECVLSEQGAMNIVALHSAVPVRIGLNVKESDAEKALEILQLEEHDKSIFFRKRDDKVNITADPCPKCGSKYVSRESLSFSYIAFSVLLLGIPYILRKNNWFCRYCNARWINELHFHHYFFSFILLIFVILLWGTIFHLAADYYGSY